MQNAQTLAQYQQAIVQLNAIGRQRRPQPMTQRARCRGPNASAVATAVMQLTQASNALSNDLIQQNLATDVPTIQFVAQDAVKQATTRCKRERRVLIGWVGSERGSGGAVAGDRGLARESADAAPSSVVTNVTTAAPTSVFTPVVIGAIALGAAGVGYYLWQRNKAHKESERE